MLQFPLILLHKENKKKTCNDNYKELAAVAYVTNGNVWDQPILFNLPPALIMQCSSNYCANVL